MKNEKNKKHENKQYSSQEITYNGKIAKKQQSAAIFVTKQQIEAINNIISIAKKDNSTTTKLVASYHIYQQTTIKAQ